MVLKVNVQLHIIVHVFFRMKALVIKAEIKFCGPLIKVFPGDLSYVLLPLSIVINIPFNICLFC